MSDEMKREPREKREPRGEKEGYQRADRPHGGKDNAHSDHRFAKSGEQNGKKPFHSANGGNGASRRPYAAHEKGERGEARGEKSAFRGGYAARSGEDRPNKGGFRRENGENAHHGGEHTAFHGEKRAFGGDRGANRPDRHGENGVKVGETGEKRSFARPAGDRPYGRPASGSDTRRDRPYGRPAPAGDGRRGPYGRPAPRTDAPAHAHTDGLPSRRLALAVLREVTENGAYASLALDSKLENCGLSHEDRRLVSRLVYDTLENLLYLDHALSQVMAKPDTDIRLRNVMRLGACQILLEDRIPESAATNTSVNLCKEIGLDALAGVCNGILRNLIRKKDELEWPDEEAEPIRALSVRYSMPEWLVERLLQDYGHDEAVALMRAHPDNTSITVRPNMLQLDDEAFEALLAGKVWAHEPGKVPHSWRIRGMVDVSHDADFVGGHFSIQSESSMMACMALAPRRGMTVLDVCAAPGGKTCLMAEMMGGTGRVQAWDVHEHRVDLIEAQCRRLALENVRPIIRDTLKYREELLETADAVLLDAPCSGTGDMMDKPDVKYRVTPESVAELTDIQRRMLDNVAAYVKRGGVLVYSTCSVLKDENERQVADFLTRHPEYTLEPLPETIPEAFRAHQATGLQLLPHRDGVGGFYIARMRRKRV